MSDRTALANEVDTHFVGSLAVTSDYVHRGLSQSSEDPALQLGAGARRTDGYYGHVWLSTLDTHLQAPDFGDRSGYEANFVIGVAKRLSDRWMVDTSLGWYETFATDQILDYDYVELSVALSFVDRLRMLYAFSPKATDHTRANQKLNGPRHVAEISYEQPLLPAVSISAGIGYADLEEVSEVRYSYGSVAVNARFQRYLASLAWIAADADARERFIDGRADSRVVITLIVGFGGR